jgi:hypothetical protein
MVMISKRSILLAKTETTYGVDPTPSESTDAFLGIDAVIKETFEPAERPIQQSSLSMRPSLRGKRFAEIKFKLELQGSGTAGTAPRHGRLLEACGLSETIVPSTSVTYKPKSSSIESVTIYLYMDGRLHKVTGAVGDFVLTAEAGNTGIYDFTFNGLYNAPTVVALPSATYESSTPVVIKNQTFSYNSKTTLIVNKFVLSSSNEVSQRPSLSSSDGISGFIITARKPTFTVDPEGQFETSYDFRNDSLTSQRALSLTLGSIATLSIPKTNITDIEYSSRDGVTIETLSGECAQDTGDDEFSLVFTG